MKNDISRNKGEIEFLENSIMKIEKIESNENLDSRTKIQLHDIKLDLKKIMNTRKSENPYKKIIMRFIKILLFIFIIKYIRKSIRENEVVTYDLKRSFDSIDTEQFIFNLASVAASSAILILLTYLFFKGNKKGKEIFLSPIVLSLITFILIDITLVLVFPEVTISVLKAYLFG